MSLHIDILSNEWAISNQGQYIPCIIPLNNNLYPLIGSIRIYGVVSLAVFISPVIVYNLSNHLSYFIRLERIHNES